MRATLWTTTVAISLGLGASSAAADEPSAPLLIAFLGPQDAAEARGAELGVAEANVLGEFTGRRFALEYQSAGMKPPAIAPVARLVVDDLARNASADAAILNLSDDRDSLRRSCQPELFHVLPSAAMARAAEVQWLQRNLGSPVRATAWHADFVKFAARDLNKRYRKKYAEPMSPQAWVGWVAVKAVVEAATRSSATEPAAIAAFMRDSLEFDGQKGVALSFGKDGQLRQPLLLIQDGKNVGESPLDLTPATCNDKPEEN